MNRPLRNSFAHTLSNVGRQFPPQTLIHKSTFKINDVPISHIYLVVPDGQSQGDYWEISERNLRRLQRGMSPQEIGCELANPSDVAPEHPEEDDACSDADRRYQSKREEQF